jgi:hypothetical protein
MTSASYLCRGGFFLFLLSYRFFLYFFSSVRKKPNPNWGLGEAQKNIPLSPNPYGSRTVYMIYYLEISFPEAIAPVRCEEDERKNCR